jgi:hypothetical protein
MGIQTLHYHCGYLEKVRILTSFFYSLIGSSSRSVLIPDHSRDQLIPGIPGKQFSPGLLEN